MKIILLTHERELDRPSNTGALAMDAAGGQSGLVRRVIWSRTTPDQALLSELQSGHCGLVYPVSEVAGEEMDVADCEQFILLDATWQEARKMYNRSPYLHYTRRVHLKTSNVSRYALRRNQKTGGLCTAECVIEILRIKGHSALASEIEARFIQFNTRHG